jgi:anti-anti-sigma factor
MSVMAASIVPSDVPAVSAAPRLSIEESDRNIAWLDRDGTRTAVWLDGEHDIATIAVLADTLARAIFVDDADLIVDLAAVTFMDAATIGVLIRARNILRPHSRKLTLRSPPRYASLVLGLCGLSGLLEAA